MDPIPDWVGETAFRIYATGLFIILAPLSAYLAWEGVTYYHAAWGYVLAPMSVLLIIGGPVGLIKWWLVWWRKYHP